MPEYLNHKTKSFDSEQQMIAQYGLDAAWQGQPTKCFSCENDAVKQKGDISGGFLAKTMKYY